MIMSRTRQLGELDLEGQTPCPQSITTTASFRPLDSLVSVELFPFFLVLLPLVDFFTALVAHRSVHDVYTNDLFSIPMPCTGPTIFALETRLLVLQLDATHWKPLTGVWIESEDSRFIAQLLPVFLGRHARWTLVHELWWTTGTIR